jgi:antitoxin component YwqK of YwqJK toxin-antitoxin module
MLRIKFIVFKVAFCSLGLIAQNCVVDSLGRLQGPCTEVFGEEYIVRDVSYTDGVLEGPYVVRYTWDKGPLIISRGEFRNGQKHGLVYEYDVSGRLKATWSYKDGILHGVVTRYAKGKLLMIERYENGLANGLWQIFHKNGKPKVFFYCKDDALGDLHYLDKQGKVYKVVKRKRGQQAE